MSDEFYSSTQIDYRYSSDHKGNRLWLMNDIVVQEFSSDTNLSPLNHDRLDSRHVWTYNWYCTTGIISNMYTHMYICNMYIENIQFYFLLNFGVFIDNSLTMYRFNKKRGKFSRTWKTVKLFADPGRADYHWSIFKIDCCIFQSKFSIRIFTSN